MVQPNITTHLIHSVAPAAHPFEKVEMSAKVSVLAVLLSVFVVCGAQAATKEIQWYNNFNQGAKIARETGKPMLLDFQADWCGPCKAMEIEFWPKQNVVEIAEKFVCVNIDIDKETAIAAKYQANPIPLMVIADPWSNQIYRHTGYRNLEGLLNVMKAMPGDFSEVVEWGDLLKKDDKNGRAMVGLAEFYHKNGIADLSVENYKRALKTKDLETDLELREGVFLKLGINYLRMKNYAEAQKVFERCLKELPAAKQADQAMVGVVFAQIGQSKLADAEKMLAQLQAKFPDSRAAQRGAEQLNAAKSQKTK